MRNYLRFVLAATLLTACAIFAVLWVRSYWSWDYVGWGVTLKQGFLLCSQSGGVILQYYDFSHTTATLVSWQLRSIPSPQSSLLPIAGLDESWGGFYFEYGESGFLLALPYWFLLLLAAAFAVALWIRWKPRFSVRTLLIATTLIAAVLGMVVLSTR